MRIGSTYSRTYFNFILFIISSFLFLILENMVDDIPLVGLLFHLSILNWCFYPLLFLTWTEYLMCSLTVWTISEFTVRVVYDWIDLCICTSSLLRPIPRPIPHQVIYYIFSIGLRWWFLVYHNCQCWCAFCLSLVFYILFTVPIHLMFITRHGKHICQVPTLFSHLIHLVF